MQFNLSIILIGPGQFNFIYHGGSLICFGIYEFILLFKDNLNQVQQLREEAISSASPSSIMPDRPQIRPL
jgi:hypothetical protein